LHNCRWVFCVPRNKNHRLISVSHPCQFRNSLPLFLIFHYSVALRSAPLRSHRYRIPELNMVRYSEPIRFVPENATSIPNRCGAYQVGLHRESGFVVKYIGRARGCERGTSLRVRFNLHVRGLGNDGLSEHMQTRMTNHLWFRYHITENGHQAAVIEVEYMQRKGRPEYNRRTEYPPCQCGNRCATLACPCKQNGRNCGTVCHPCSNK